jgi:hypothetical protein
MQLDSLVQLDLLMKLIEVDFSDFAARPDHKGHAQSVPVAVVQRSP